MWNGRYGTQLGYPTRYDQRLPHLPNLDRMISGNPYGLSQKAIRKMKRMRLADSERKETCKNGPSVAPVALNATAKERSDVRHLPEDGLSDVPAQYKNRKKIVSLRVKDNWYERAILWIKTARGWVYTDRDRDVYVGDVVAVDEAGFFVNVAQDQERVSNPIHKSKVNDVVRVEKCLSSRKVSWMRRLFTAWRI